MAVGKYIRANGLDIFYREHGLGHPLVLLHGATDTHKLWDKFIPELSKIFRVITPDTRGHGRTINPDGVLSYQQLADDLAAFIQALDLDKPFVFGYSDGGQAALDLGLRYPDLTGGLILGGVWYRFSEEYQSSLKVSGFMGPGEIDFQVFEKNAPADWKERMAKAHPHSDPNYPVFLLRELAVLFWTPLHYSASDFLRISAPTLILMGEKDEMVPPAEARELADLIPGARIEIIPGATHSGVFDRGDLITRIVMDFFTHLMERNSRNDLIDPS